VNHAVVEGYTKHLTLPFRCAHAPSSASFAPSRYRVRAGARPLIPRRNPLPFARPRREFVAANQGVTAGNFARFLPRFLPRVWGLTQRWGLGAATIGPRAPSLERPGLRDKPWLWRIFRRGVSSAAVIPAQTRAPLARPQCAGANLRVAQEGWREARMKNGDSVCRFTVRQRDRWKTPL
jgi:hypothetical protein